MYVWLRYILLYTVAVARISLMNVIKVRMQSSYMCGIIMRRIHCTATVWVWLQSDIDVFTCFICIFFSYLPIFLFSHKTILRGCPKHVDVSTMNYQSQPPWSSGTGNRHGMHLLEHVLYIFTTVVVYTYINSGVYIYNL